MKRLPDYVLLTSKGNDIENPVILSTNYPYIYGEVRFPNPCNMPSILDGIANERLKAVKVPGYQVVIFLAGSMENEELTMQEITEELRNMANFFLEGWIQRNLHTYDKKYRDQ